MQDDGKSRDDAADLRERIEEMGGSFEIQSAPEKGAEVTITVPAGKEKG